VVLLIQIDVLGEMSGGKQPVTHVLDHVQDSHRLLVIAHEDDMINFVNEEQKQQVTYVVGYLVWSLFMKKCFVLW
jgi:hypothetical protein